MSCRACVALLPVAALLVLAGIYTTWRGVHEYVRPGPLMEQKTVILPRGTGVREIGELLTREGVARHALVFSAAAGLSGRATRFKAGEYAFPPGVALREVIDMLTEGNVVIHKVTVPEGLTVREIVALLAAEPALEGEAPTDILEGALLPETYHFIRGDTRAAVIGRMRQAMDAALAELWPRRKEGLPIASPQEAVTLASIVEKETSVSTERPRVAAVYINRLRQGMKLQADPTVIYGVEQQAGTDMARSLSRADLQAPTPFNTYANTGLPPTPIASPGRASIEAVLNPLETKELYFVADGRGGHVFAETLEQHNRNVAAYRAFMREQSRTLP